MTEYRSGQSPTFSMLATMMAMTTLPFVAPAQAMAFSAQSYTPLQAPSTGQISHVKRVEMADPGALMSAMVDCYRHMSEAQVPLDPDIAKILHQNLWNLYVED
jgi:hypothetical protein